MTRECETATNQAKKVPNAQEEAIISERYLEYYNSVFQQVSVIFANTRRKRQIDVEGMGELIASGHLWELCKGIEAITQIHNMEKNEEDYLLHNSIQVAILAGLMARWLKYPLFLRRKLILAGLLHDIGLLDISKDILDKPAKLTDTEMNLIKRHPKFGSDFLVTGNMQNEKEILSGIYEHHERNDGSGYPLGLKKDEIGDFGKIIGILDTYIAMSTDKVYSTRRSPFDIFKIISEDIIKNRLDTTFGILFIKKVCHALTGSWVRLTNDKKAKIIYIDESRIDVLPIVQTEDGEFIDLNTSPIKIKLLLTFQEATA